MKMEQYDDATALRRTVIAERLAPRLASALNDALLERPGWEQIAEALLSRIEGGELEGLDQPAHGLPVGSWGRNAHG